MKNFPLHLAVNHNYYQRGASHYIIVEAASPSLLGRIIKADEREGPIPNSPVWLVDGVKVRVASTARAVASPVTEIDGVTYWGQVATVDKYFTHLDGIGQQLDEDHPVFPAAVIRPWSENVGYYGPVSTIRPKKGDDDKTVDMKIGFMEDLLKRRRKIRTMIERAWEHDYQHYGEGLDERGIYIPNDMMATLHFTGRGHVPVIMPATSLPDSFNNGVENLKSRGFDVSHDTAPVMQVDVHISGEAVVRTMLNDEVDMYQRIKNSDRTVTEVNSFGSPTIHSLGYQPSGYGSSEVSSEVAAAESERFDELIRKIIEVGNNHDMCSDFDDALAEAELPQRTFDYNVDIDLEVTGTVEPDYETMSIGEHDFDVSSANLCGRISVRHQVEAVDEDAAMSQMKDMLREGAGDMFDDQIPAGFTVEDWDVMEAERV